MSHASQSEQDRFAEERFLILFFRMVQVLRLHDDNNDLVKVCLSALNKTASAVLTERELSVVILEGGYYVQGRRVHYHRKTGQFIRRLLETFIDAGLYGFIFYPAFRDAPPEEVLWFFRAIIRSFEMEKPHEWLSERVEDRRLCWVDLFDADKARELIDDPSFLQRRAREAYRCSVASVMEVARKLPTGASTGIHKIERVVHNMIDIAQEDEGLLLGLSTIKDYDDYTYVHSVNVAVLAVCLGNRIGLSKTELTHLGICGLFHDVGKVEVDPEIVKKPGKLDESEFLEIQRHPLASMRQILKLKTSLRIKSRVFLAPVEHHLNFDLSGYPRIESKDKVSLFGRILKIADVYDAITSPRVYRTYFYSPDQALRMMMEKSGKDFDPILLKIFAAMLGIYPVGTLLVLDTGELGIAIGQSGSQPRALPKVLLLEKGDEGNFVQGEIADLDERDTRTGARRRNIVRSFHPAVCGIQPAEFMVGYEQAEKTGPVSRSLF
jgi:HD-GYP domain-containing protein (c-di-GMP phosphodiesterase class II)